MTFVSLWLCVSVCLCVCVSVCLCVCVSVSASAFVFVFLSPPQLTAPECSFPDVSYTQKWTAITLLPIGAVALFACVYVVVAVWQRLIKGQKKAAGSAAGALYSAAITLFYVLYLHLARTVFDVFNCQKTDPPDGQRYGYLQAVFEPCFVAGGVHMTLLPFAIAALAVYLIGFPAFCAYKLLRNRLVVQEDQLLRAMRIGTTKSTNPRGFGFRRRFQRLYYNFRPLKFVPGVDACDFPAPQSPFSRVACPLAVACAGFTGSS